MTILPTENSAATTYATLHRFSLPPTLDSVRCIVPEDIVDLSVKHLILLHAVDTFPDGGLYAGPWLQEAARRYTRLWLPLLAELEPEDRDLITPPLDIAYVWYLHRLNAQSYQTYCLTHFGTTLQPTPTQAFSFTSNAFGYPTTRWSQAYPSEPFYPPTVEQSSSAQLDLEKFKQDGFDVIARAAVHAPYLKHYLRACYYDKAYLEQATQRYCKYLLLSCTFSGQQLTPNCDIDLIWRTHISVLGAISVPCSQVLRQVITYDAGLHTCYQHPQLRSAFKRTRALWSVQFPGQSFVIPGSDYVPAASSFPVEAKVQAELSNYSHVNASGDLSDGPRAGAHALYLQWMDVMARQHEDDKEKNKKGMMSLFREKRGLVERRAKADVKYRAAAAHFKEFQNLPHCRTHEYWQALAEYCGPRRMAGGLRGVSLPKVRRGGGRYNGTYSVVREDGEVEVGRMELDWVVLDTAWLDSNEEEEEEEMLMLLGARSTSHPHDVFLPMAA